MILSTVLTLVKSTNANAPSDSHSSFFLSPPSTAITFIPIATAYCTARCPSPPPAPTITTVSPGFTSVSFSALYVVTPAQRIGAACWSLTLSGIFARWLATALQYSWKDPSAPYPELSCFGHTVSFPFTQNSQLPHAECSHTMPTRSPILRSVTPSPSATTVPAPSWPPTSGILGLTGQSPSCAWRSVWQTPVQFTLTVTWPGAGGSRGTTSMPWEPNSRTTAAL
mmetsp:Transcript_10430/g.27355  ORF Transcript_10430/g.27355 Transcript_10430/m.27355 type:complete len:225 (+) Transcript_10430:651-1325(+)